MTESRPEKEKQGLQARSSLEALGWKTKENRWGEGKKESFLDQRLWQ